MVRMERTSIYVYAVRPFQLVCMRPMHCGAGNRSTVVRHGVVPFFLTLWRRNSPTTHGEWGQASAIAPQNVEMHGRILKPAHKQHSKSAAAKA